MLIIGIAGGTGSGKTTVVKKIIESLPPGEVVLLPQDSYSRRGEHYVRGHYSRSDGRDAYDDYMTQKQSYRSGKSEDCKRKMLAALEEHLDELTTEMSDMSKDAECREERDLVKRYVEKLRDML